MRKVRVGYGGKMGLDSAGFLQDISSLLFFWAKTSPSK